MITPLETAIAVGALSLLLLIVIRHYERDIDRQRRRADRAEARAERLLNELDEATRTIDEYLDAALTRHPANTPRKPGLSVITGGAS